MIDKFLTENPNIPPLKWAGGKRWFVSGYSDILPKSFNKYIEPFFGSGAVFFSINPKNAVISDINSEIINLYEIIRDDPVGITEKLKYHQRHHSESYYYSVRAMKPRSKLGMAARTLYLNRTCWNGLYRVNLNGVFNVPKGTKNSVILESDDFKRLSSVLSGVDIRCQDFEIVIDSAMKDDFIFVDPPYTVAHNNNGFIKYNQHLFSWSDQLRLRDSLIRASGRGVKFVLTNAAHSSVKELYDGFDQIVVNRAGVISGDITKRGRFEELVVKWG